MAIYIGGIVEISSRSIRNKSFFVHTCFFISIIIVQHKILRAVNLEDVTVSLLNAKKNIFTKINKIASHVAKLCLQSAKSKF